MASDLDIRETGHDAMRTGLSPWGGARLRPPHLPLGESISVDVAVIGGGITGALAAEHLTGRGLSVCVVDREQPGLGSTAASTAMLQWEIDCTLTELTQFYGFERAAATYHRSLAAVAGLTALMNGHAIGCDNRPRPSLYLAGTPKEAADVVAEHALRERAGLPGFLLDHPQLLEKFRLDRAAAILSPGCAEADPLLLAWSLLDVAAKRGARMVKATATAFDSEGSRVTVETDSPYVIEAQHVVLATGYVMPGFIMPKLHAIASSWAMATPPQRPGSLWPQQALIWEAGDPYLYARTTVDNRIVVGGEDDDTVEPDARDAKLPQKIATIRDKLGKLWPDADTTVDYAWCGAFGETTDGLPLIGPVTDHPRIFSAYGYGGNGITFSYMASRMIAAFIAGENQAWFEDFALDRDDPTA